MRQVRQGIQLLGIAVLFWVVGVSTAGAQSRSIILSTTTSTQDSGLLEVLIPLFEKLVFMQRNNR